MVQANVVNVVATVALNLDSPLDLDALGRFKEIVHDVAIYGGRVAYFRTSDMQGKVSIFSSGKMISVGTRSQKKAAYELELAKEYLVRKGFVKPITINPKIQNIVAVADFNRKIDLEEFARKHRVIYEPEQFPGGILRIKKPHSATILLYASGRAVITGLKSANQIDPTINIIQKMLLSLKSAV